MRAGAVCFWSTPCLTGGAAASSKEGSGKEVWFELDVVAPDTMDGAGETDAAHTDAGPAVDLTEPTAERCTPAPLSP
ncbi:hypothetical protein [Streptomyces sp. NBC_01518]|uniref:hypothetical protein n=1 Tax=Streptomyces sp. NBC_01518 TaxID=2903891 RepID=UPI003866DA51